MRIVSCRRSLVIAALVAAAQCGVASAQMHSGRATDIAAYMSGLRIDREMLAGPLAGEQRSVARLDDPGLDQQPREVSLVGSAVMLEMRPAGPDGQFVRPRVVIGRQSHELKRWMSSMGVTAERCVLPQFRGRLKRDPETRKVGAAVLVTARCTFY